MFTAIYSFRLLEQVFWSDFTGFKSVITKHSKTTGVELFVLGFLGILSLTTGYFFKDMFSGFGSNYFNTSINILPSNWLLLEAEFIPVLLKALPLVLTLFAFEVSSRFFECKWFYNEIVNGYLTLPVMVLSRHFFEQYEKLFLERNGPLFFQSIYERLQYAVHPKV